MTNTFKFLTLLLTFFIIGCQNQTKQIKLKLGDWRGVIHTQNQAIPFVFNISKNNQYSIAIKDGNQTLNIDDVNVNGDSISFDLHIFDATIKAQFDNQEMNGVFIKNYAKDYVLNFSAKPGISTRFDQKTQGNAFDGKWETTFTKKDGSQFKGIGVFKTENDQLKGTFLTKTGDYRFLEGFANQNSMQLATFDGNHIYKFEAQLEQDSVMVGQFWSGKTGYYTFRSVKNDQATLPNANSLTYLKDGYDGIEFSFPGLDGNPVTLKDSKYQNKVVILQILGTWCPNCMDETKFLAQWYKDNKSKDVAIIGLAYENKKRGQFNLDYAISRVNTMKKQLDAQYDFVIAGESTSQAASESLPMLNKVMSFPTTIFIDKKGVVRKIHTGFSGPATGDLYDAYVLEFNNFMTELLSE